MYRKDGTGVIVTTSSGSIYQLDRLALEGYDYYQQGNSNLYMVTQINDNKVSKIDQPVIAYSYKKGFFVGDKLDLAITDDKQNGRFRNQRFITADIVSVRATRERADFLNDLHPEVFSKISHQDNIPDIGDSFER